MNTTVNKPKSASISSRVLPQKSELPALLRDPRSFVIRYRLPLLILWAGASADLWTTLVNMEKYGPSIEAHVVQRTLSELFGVAVGVPLAKLLQLACVIGVAAWRKPWCRWILIVCGLLYAAAGLSNHFMWL